MLVFSTYSWDCESKMAVKQHHTTIIIIVLGLLASILVKLYVPANWLETQLQYPVVQDSQGHWSFEKNGKLNRIDNIVPYSQAIVRQEALSGLSTAPEIRQQWVQITQESNPILLKAEFHYGWWSLLPAALAIILCLVSKEPLLALFCGIVSGGLILGRYDISADVLIPNIGTQSAASILILYLWLLGGLMGIWGKTGAAQAFAQMMSERFVRGPRSAKLVTWCLGVLFFQGGTMSTVLVGTTVKPMADKAQVSHEELSYVVDSTASPIASVIAFNAWPAYVQAFLFVPGVAFLATEQDRIQFFFASIPFSFYGIFAVLGTLLLSLNFTMFSGKGLKRAIDRARLTGQLDGENANPISAKELHQVSVPAGYLSHWLEFVVPLTSLILVAILTFAVSGTPQIHWAFASALLIAIAVAMVKGMTLRNVLDGLSTGWKGVVVASIILMLAITIGAISKELGGGIFLVELLGEQLPFWMMPVLLQLLTMLIAFSTGTSWGTYAVAFPLAMPLVWAVAQNEALAQPEVFMMVCFAAVLNGSVYGDQCSPISDTTILSSMTTGCDLMDHVKTQIVPATYAAALAGVMWTLTVLIWY